MPSPWTTGYCNRNDSSFDVVAVLGTGNARALASGITMATLPTMVGMTISIIGLLIMAYLRNLSIKHRIDQ